MSGIRWATSRTDVLRALPADDRAQCPAPVRLRRVRAARPSSTRSAPASTRASPPRRNIERHARPSCGGWAWATTSGARSSTTDRLVLPVDAVDLPADLQQLVRRTRSAGPGRSASWSPSSRRGTRQPPERTVPGPSWPRPSAGDLLDGYRLAYLSESWSTGAPAWAPCSRTRRSPPTGAATRGNFPVYRRPLRQWMLRITAYADRLIGDLDRRRLAGIGQAHAAELDRDQPTERPSTSSPSAGRGRLIERVHHPPGHPVRRHLPGAGSRAPAGRRADCAAWPSRTPASWRYRAGAERCPRRRVAATGRGRPQSAGPRSGADHDRRYKTGVFTGAYAINPGHRRADAGVRRRLRADGLRDRARSWRCPPHDQRDLEFATGVRAAGHRAVRVLRTSGSAQHSTRPEPRPGNGRRRSPARVEYVQPGLPLAGLGQDAAIEATIGWLERRGTGTPGSPSPAAGLAVLPAALLGRAVPDRLRRDTGCRSRCPSACCRCSCPRSTDFPPATLDARRRRRPSRCRRWRARPSWVHRRRWTWATAPQAYRRETQHDAAVGRVVLVLPALPGPGQRRRASSTRRSSGTGWARSTRTRRRRPVRRRRRARGAAPAVRPLLAQGAVRPGPRLDRRSRSARLFNQGYIQADAYTDGRGHVRRPRPRSSSGDGGYRHRR